MKDCLVVVDMQVDFITGALGTPEAVEIVPEVCARIRKAADEGAGGFCGRGFADALPCPPVCADGCDEDAGAV